MIKSKEEIISSIKSKLGDDTSDEAISLLEDITDTITDFETKAKGDGEDWKAKYEKNDAEWRQKYIDRFNSTDPQQVDINPETNPADEDKPPRKFDELFKTE